MTNTPHPAGAFGGVDWDSIASQAKKSREAFDAPFDTDKPSESSASLIDLRRSTQHLDAARTARRNRRHQAKPTFSAPAFDEPELETEDELEL